MSRFKNPNDYYGQKDDKKGLISSVVLHFLLLIGIIVGALDKDDSAAGPLQLELWTEGTEQIVAPPAETRTPDPADEDTRTDQEEPPEESPPPEPEVEEPKEDAPPPKVAPPKAVANQEKPDIALKKKLQQEKAAKEKAERLAKEKAEKEKAEKEAKKKAEKLAKEKIAKEKAAKEAKAKAEREAKAKAAKAKMDARLAAETKVKANSQGDALRAAMRGDINSRAGIKGGFNDRNQIGGGGGTDAYARLVKACVEPRLRFSGNQRLKVRYKVEFNGARKVTNARITRTSGNKAFDNAALNALKLCNPFPKPPTGNNYVEGNYEFRPR